MGTPDNPICSDKIGKLAAMAKARMHGDLDVVCCDCEIATPAVLNDELTHFICSFNECEFNEPIESFMTIRVHPSWKPVLDYSRLTDDEIIYHLEDRCNMKWEKFGREVSLKFGRFLHRRFNHLGEWTRESAANEWQPWKKLYLGR